MAVTQGVQNSLRDLLDIVFRHKGKSAAFFLLTLVCVTLYTYLAPEIYRSEAKLLVRLGRENLSVDPTVEGPMVGLIQNRENEVKSELAILSSQELAGTVVQTLGVDRFLRHPDEEASTPEWEGTGQGALRSVRKVVSGVKSAFGRVLVALDVAPALTPEAVALKKLTGGLEVEVERNSNIINIAFESQSGQLACDTLAELTRQYLERHIRAYSAQASPEFFEDQSKKLEAELAAREQELDAYRREHGIAALDQQKEVLLDQIRQLENLRAESTAKADAAAAEVEVLRQAVGQSSKEVELTRTTGYTNWAADYVKQRLTDLREKEMDLSSRYTADYRPLQEVREQIAGLESQLAKEEETHTQVERGLNPTFQSLDSALRTREAELAADRAGLEAFTAQLNAASARLDTLTEQELKFQQLTREKELAEKEYREYRDNLQRARISAALDLDKVSNVTVVQPATLPLDAVRPRKLRNIALGAFMGLLGGLALAFVAQHADDTLKTDTEVTRRLGLPVLATVTDGEFKSCI